MTTKRMLIPTLALVLAAVCIAGALAAKKPPPKKPPVKKPSAASGIQPAMPMPGQWAELNKPYYLGQDKQIVFTLKSCAFSCDRLYFGDEIVTAGGQEKLLILKFSLQNPKKEEWTVNWSTVRFTAVDSQDNNREGTDYVGQDINKQKLDMRLKPAQKVECYTCIRLPNDCLAPKLIVKPSDDGPVLRYDLHGKVKGLEPPFADPNDTTGATALADVPAEKGNLYPGINFDFTFDGIAFVGGTYGDSEPNEGYGWAVVSATMKNMAKEKQSINWATLIPKVKGKSGSLDFTNGVFASAEDQGGFGTDMEPGDTIGVKYAFPVRKGAQLTSFSLQETDEGRRYVWDLGAVKAEF